MKKIIYRFKNSLFSANILGETNSIVTSQSSFLSQTNSHIIKSCDLILASSPHVTYYLAPTITLPATLFNTLSKLATEISSLKRYQAYQRHLISQLSRLMCERCKRRRQKKLKFLNFKLFFIFEAKIILLSRVHRVDVFFTAWKMVKSVH